MPGAQQARRHRLAHGAKADKSDLHARFLPSPKVTAAF
jgi:hypothetical protein